ncbi:hypothetical protein SDC9_112449 [bioreactor metagenome]|uniref:Uncharacterized protein n=1 Tax=bioreactor metagenome TaxID=1076179 RepID=A0A645BJZ6_9ZZZZ
MDFRTDVGCDQPNDPFAIGLGQLHAHRCSARRKPVDPQGAIRVEHDFHHVRVFECRGDQWPHRGAKHLDAAI